MSFIPGPRGERVPMYPPGPKTDWSPALRPQVPPIKRRIIGLDLGKAVDYTALCVLDWLARPGATYRPTYHVPALKRWPLGTPYTVIAAWLVKFFLAPDDARRGEPPPILVVDATGVGAAVVEIIRTALGDALAPGFLVSITITAGSAATLAVDKPGCWRVAKSQLASVLVMLWQCRRLEIAVELPEAATLIKEAQSFTVKVTPAGNETYESWREGEHDDLVLALGLGCWAAENLDPLPWPPTPPVAGYQV